VICGHLKFNNFPIQKQDPELDCDLHHIFLIYNLTVLGNFNF